MIKLEKKYIVDDATAQADVARFAAALYLESYVEDEFDRVVELVRRGFFKIDESGAGTYRMRSAVPDTVPQELLIHEPDGNSVLLIGTGGAGSTLAYMATITKVALPLVHRFKAVDIKALLQIATFIVGG
jgi:hypothetical protein